MCPFRSRLPERKKVFGRIFLYSFIKLQGFGFQFPLRQTLVIKFSLRLQILQAKLNRLGPHTFAWRIVRQKLNFSIYVVFVLSHVVIVFVIIGIIIPAQSRLYQMDFDVSNRFFVQVGTGTCERSILPRNY